MGHTYIPTTKFRLKIKRFNFYIEIKGGHIEQFPSQRHLPSFEPMKRSTCAGKRIRLTSRNSCFSFSGFKKQRAKITPTVCQDKKINLNCKKNQAQKLWNPLFQR